MLLCFQHWGGVGLGFFFFLQSMIHLDIKLIYKAPGVEDKSRPISSNAEVVATVMPLS